MFAMQFTKNKVESVIYGPFTVSSRGNMGDSIKDILNLYLHHSTDF